MDWLHKSNTCPVCRYELETDDAEYEVIRIEKMKHIQPRFAKYELDRMPIRELRQLSHNLNVSLVGCMEKQEMIEALVKSGKLQVIAAPEPVEYPLSLLRAMGIGELKRCMADAGVFFDPLDVVEKEDMVQIFIKSGRLVVVEEHVDEEENVMEVDESASFASQEPTADAAREECNDNGHRNKTVPADVEDESSTGVPIVTTVNEDSDDDEAHVVVGNRFESDRYPESHPLMEEIPFNEAVASTAVDENTSFADEMDSGSSEQSRDPFDDAERSPDSEGRGTGTCLDVQSASQAEHEQQPMDHGVSDGEATRSVADEDVDMQHEESDEDVEIAYPRLVGRHASTGSEDVSLVEEYASTTTASEHSRFEERSVNDLQALAREMQVDISDCIERSEIIGRLIRASGRSDARLEPNDFASWSVSELRALAREVHVDLSNCTDRLTMIAELIEAANHRPRVADYLSALMPLARLTVPQLRAVGREWQVNLYDCIEKEEMIHRLVIAGGPASS